jgi:hypothetical protein
VRTLSAVDRAASRSPLSTGLRLSPGELKLLAWTSSPSSLKNPFCWAMKKAMYPIQALNPTR